MKNKTPEQCRQCKKLWTHGIKEGGRDRWCCKFGKPSYKAIGHCILKDGLEQK